jgi:O-Antigen ligase
MIPYRLGFWTWIAYLLIDFGQVHRIIPGMSHLMLGALATVTMIALVLIEMPRGLSAPGGGWLRPLVVWRVLFLLSIAVGLLLAITQGRAFLVLKMEVPRFLAAFMGALLFLRTLPDLRKVLTAMLIMDFLISAWVIAHHGHGPGLYIDENDAGLVLVMLLPFPFLRIFAPDTKPAIRVLSIGVFALSLCAIGITLSRGAMVGSIPALVFCWLKSRQKVLSLALGGVALVLAVLFAPSNFIKEFESIGDTHESTAEARRYYWDLSTQMWPHHPIFGVGAMCWGNALYSGMIPMPEHRAHMTPHSIYFQCWTELGLFGMFCWIGFIAAAFRETASLGRRKLQAGLAMAAGGDPDPAAVARLRASTEFLGPFASCLAIGMVGYLVCGAFLSVVFYPGLALFAAIAQASAAVWRRELLIEALRGRAEAPRRLATVTELPRRGNWGEDAPAPAGTAAGLVSRARLGFAGPGASPSLGAVP